MESKKRKFKTGAIRDVVDDKENFVESVSWLALRRFAQYMLTKEKLYGKGNWKKGIPIDVYEESLLRHINKYLINKYDDAGVEGDEDHLSAAMFNLQGIIHEEEKEKLKLKNSKKKK